MRTIPPITKNLLIINVLMFLASWVFETQHVDLGYYLGLHFFLAPDFHVYQLVTYMFMHANIGHIFFNMFALWMFGCVLENVLGPKRFLIYYFACGIGAGLIQEIAQTGALYMMLSHTISITVGASGAIYGVLLAFGMLFPNERIFIFPIPIPIKAKWFITFYILIELFSALSTTSDGVAHTAHLGGMLIGFFMIRYWQHHPGSYYGYNNGGRNIFDKMRDSWEKHTRKRPEETPESPRDSNPDWEYNARKKKNQEEIDHILDKIRRSGYDSLTEEEKKKLFDSSDE